LAQVNAVGGMSTDIVEVATSLQACLDNDIDDIGIAVEPDVVKDSSSTAEMRLCQ